MAQKKTEKFLEEELEKYCVITRKEIDDKIDIFILQTVLDVVEKNKEFNESDWERDSNGQFSRYLGGKDGAENEEYGDAKDETYNQKILENEANTWEEKLNEKEKFSVRDYTSDDYMAINASLRNLKNRGFPVGDVNEKIENIDTAISKFNLKEDIRVYRGTSMELLETMGIDPSKELVGQKICDKGYMSTSVSHEQAEEFVKRLGVDDTSVMLDIDVGAENGIGAYLEGLSELPKECEFLFGRDRVLTITKTGTVTIEDRGVKKEVFLIKATMEEK